LFLQSTLATETTPARPALVELTWRNKEEEEIILHNVFFF